MLGKKIKIITRFKYAFLQECKAVKKLVILNKGHYGNSNSSHSLEAIYSHTVVVSPVMKFAGIMSGCPVTHATFFKSSKRWFL